jgi:hypothetical protein
MSRLLCWVAILTTLTGVSNALADDSIVPVFRLRHSGTNVFRLTSSCAERRAISDLHFWVDEGVFGYAPIDSTAQNPSVAMIHYTKQGQDLWLPFFPPSAQFFTSNQWQSQPADFSVFLSGGNGRVPFWGLSKDGRSWWTTDQGETTSLENGGWKSQLYGYVYDSHIDPCPIPHYQDGGGFGNLNPLPAIGAAGQTAGSAARHAVGPTWEYVKSDWGPAINQGALHFGKQVIDVLGHAFVNSCTDTPNQQNSCYRGGAQPVVRPGDTIEGDVPIQQAPSGPKIHVTFENLAPFPHTLEIFDNVARVWIARQTLPADGTISVELTPDDTGHGYAVLRYDHDRQNDTDFSFLSDNDVRPA